ncbi:MAG TPA: hypothetical protein EYP49_15840 [Anaerolineae bacterium]|nr:hypothetical protein [Anaerolineae bacterium]
MVLTMAAVAANKGIRMEKLEAQVDAVTDVTEGGQRTRFSTLIDLGQGLTNREIKILFNSARRCEVHKLLGGQIEFEEKLAESS